MTTEEINARAIPASTLNAQRPLTLVSKQEPAREHVSRKIKRPRERTFHYVTIARKGARTLPDGTLQHYVWRETVRVPFVKERATSTRKSQTVVTSVDKTRTTADDHRRIIANLHNDHDYTAQ